MAEEQVKTNQQETDEETIKQKGNSQSEADASDIKEEAPVEKDSAGEDAGKKEEKKGWRDRKKDKESEKKDAQIEELNDRLKRSMAEFDNFRKRTEKEKAAMFEVGAKSVIEKILPVVDNFERGLKALPEEEKESPFAEGMDKIYKQLLTTLEELEVKPIEAVGCEFDPDFHNAVMHVEDEEAGENVIVEEFQKGYTYRDSVVRHSMVKVAN